MSGIDTKVVIHHLPIHHFLNLLVQRKQIVVEEKRADIDEEVGKLSDDGLITKTKYPTWIANIVLVHKLNRR